MANRGKIVILLLKKYINGYKEGHTNHLGINIFKNTDELFVNMN